jgi:hypothetical protein
MIIQLKGWDKIQRKNVSNKVRHLYGLCFFNFRFNNRDCRVLYYLRVTINRRHPLTLDLRKVVQEL